MKIELKNNPMVWKVQEQFKDVLRKEEKKEEIKKNESNVRAFV